jgi:hypothetical protein
LNIEVLRYGLEAKSAHILREHVVVIPVEKSLREDISTNILCAVHLHSLNKRGTGEKETGGVICHFKPQCQVAHVIFQENNVMAVSMDTVNFIGLYI